MDKYPKQKTSISVVYSVLTLMVLTVMCITVYAYFSSAANRKERSGEKSSANTKITETKHYETGSDGTGGETAAESESAVIPEDTENKDDKSSQTQQSIADIPDDTAGASATPDESEPEFGLPVNGYILKSHDLKQAVFSMTMNDYRVHSGIDIEANIGDDVYCTADGTVSRLYNDPFMGTCVEISHSGGFVSCYKNLAPELPSSIAEGAEVCKGQVIGSVGESAIIEVADSAHLHFELSNNSVMLDPIDYLPEIEAKPAADAEE